MSGSGYDYIAQRGSRISLIPAFGGCIVNLANLCYQHKLHKEVIFMDPVENPYPPVPVPRHLNWLGAIEYGSRYELLSRESGLEIQQKAF